MLPTRLRCLVLCHLHRAFGFGTSKLQCNSELPKKHSAWALRRQRNVPKSVLEDGVYISSCRSGDMWQWWHKDLNCFLEICKWSLGNLIEINIATWLFEDCKYTSYRIFWKIEIAMKQPVVPDGTSHRLTGFSWQWMWWIWVYPAQNSWISIWQNFVVGDVPRFKVFRYSEASLFEL